VLARRSVAGATVAARLDGSVQGDLVVVVIALRPGRRSRGRYGPAVVSGAIFDCDGVLVDSERAASEVLAGLITELGVETTVEEAIGTYMGRSWASCMEILESRLGGPPPLSLRDRYRAGVVAAWRRELQPVPGIEAALDEIDVPVCVASSGEHERMRLTLGLSGLLPRFEGRLFSATEVARGKPAPDLFLHAAERMGFDPATTVVVEDTVPGVQAGRAAGMRVLAFARLVPAAALQAAGGEAFDDMRRLPALVRAGAPARTSRAASLRRGPRTIAARRPPPRSAP
jgi:HAD superfamily hydrolase (TIGR01509 family)